MTNTANDGSQTKTWYDRLGRVIRSDVKGFDGRMIYTSTAYNLKGQVESVSDPYFSNEASQLNTYGWDTYGRRSSVTRPSGRNTTWSYSNNTVTETTAGKSFSKTLSSDGNLTSATDPGGTITYSYFADGMVKNIVAPGSITTSMQYDIAGNQTSLTDPSAGTISYTYNGFGELISQVNPGSVTTSISYLSDGRIDRKTTAEGVTYYRYNSNKQLSNIKSPFNVSRSLGYDSKGRVTAVTDSLPGSNPLVTSITYDSKGRKSTVTHPSAITETYGYNQNGYLASVSAGGSVRWTTTGINARGQLTTGTYGSSLNTTMGIDNYGFPTSIVTGTVQNYSFNFNPVTGNLNWRQNNKYTGLKEDFQYDNSDRLSTVTKNSVTTLTMSYDGNTGGLAGKSDAGTFSYDPFDKPYAIKTIDPTTGLVPDSTQTTGYTSFNKVESISENGYEANFIYGYDDQRSRMIVKQNGYTILTRWYPTGSYMKETAGGTTKEYTFIGGDAYTAPVAALTQGGTTTYYNLLRDHLGSITHVVSSSGTVVAEYSYDAWGRMRNPSTWTNYEPGSEPALMIAGRGFTGHEHQPWFNTINMNGRLYDPLIGMFLGPDNYVQSGDNSQNFNRYSYGLNNPLRYSDPTGMLLEPLRDPSELGIIVNPIATEYLNNIYSVGGGGGHYGTMGSGFYYTGNPYLNVYDAVDALSQSHYGGFWSSSGGIYYYANQDEAFFASCAYIDYYGYWGSTQAKNFNNAYSAYTSGINGFPDKNDLVLYASLDGIRDPDRPDPSSGGNEKLKRLYGWSIDIVIADAGGYGLEFGEIYDPNTGKHIQFFTHGEAFGVDNTGGMNFILITPKEGFKLTDLKGNGWGWSVTIPFLFVSFGKSGNSTPSYPENTRFDTYTLRKIGIGVGPGIFNNSPSSTTYINITNMQIFHFVWPGRMWY